MQRSIAELVEAFISGDDQAFAELIRRYCDKIYSLGYQILGNHFDADEVVQETFVRLYKRRRELANVKYFSTFLLRVATNYSIDLLRKRKSRGAVTDDTSSLPGDVQLDLARSVETPSQSLANKRLMEEIRSALDLLPPRQKLTAIMHDVEGYSKTEIAEALECPEATVRSNLHIARIKLRKILRQRINSKESE